MNLGKCIFPNATTFVQILHNGEPKRHEFQERVLLTGLTAGQLTNFSILAYGEMGIYSRIDFFEYTGKMIFIFRSKLMYLHSYTLLFFFF